MEYTALILGLTIAWLIIFFEMPFIFGVKMIFKIRQKVAMFLLLCLTIVSTAILAWVLASTINSYKMLDTSISPFVNIYKDLDILLVVVLLLAIGVNIINSFRNYKMIVDSDNFS